MKTPITTKKQIPEAGVHPARLVWISDLGTQTPKNPANNPARKILFVWEITDSFGEFDGEKKPLVVSQEMTFSGNEKSRLYGFTKGWLGVEPTEIDWREVVGKPALVTITHDKVGETTYANVSNVAGVPKGMTVPEPINTKLCVSLEKSEFDQEQFTALPQWIKDKIMRSPEWVLL